MKLLDVNWTKTKNIQTIPKVKKAQKTYSQRKGILMTASCNIMFSFEGFPCVQDPGWKGIKQNFQILVRFCNLGEIVFTAGIFTTCILFRALSFRRRWRQRSAWRRCCIWTARTFRWRKQRKLMPNKIKQMKKQNISENINDLGNILWND